MTQKITSFKFQKHFFPTLYGDVLEHNFGINMMESIQDKNYRNSQTTKHKGFLVGTPVSTSGPWLSLLVNLLHCRAKPTYKIAAAAAAATPTARSRRCIVLRVSAAVVWCCRGRAGAETGSEQRLLASSHACGWFAASALLRSSD